MVWLAGWMLLRPWDWGFNCKVWVRFVIGTLISIEDSSFPLMVEYAEGRSRRFDPGTFKNSPKRCHKFSLLDCPSKQSQQRRGIRLVALNYLYKWYRCCQRVQNQVIPTKTPKSNALTPQTPYVHFSVPHLINQWFETSDSEESTLSKLHPFLSESDHTTLNSVL